MITRRQKGIDLFTEVSKDYRKSVKAKITDARNKLREPYVKKRQNIEEPIKASFTLKSSANKTWYIYTMMFGDYKLPKVFTHKHCITNAGRGDSRKYVIFRGDVGAKKVHRTNGGYVVTLTPHVLTKMRERKRDVFGGIKDNDELITKIFIGDEIGIMYFHDWSQYEIADQEVPDGEESPIESFRLNENENKPDPCFIRTAAGLFLGVASKDRSHMSLITYITDREIVNENERYIIDYLVDSAYVYYNQQLFDDETCKMVKERLDDKDEDITVNMLSL